MACHVIWHDQALSPPYPVDSIHGMGAPGVGGGETVNRTTMRQREGWIRAASRLVALDSDGACTNAKQVQNSLMAEYEISRGSAKTAVAHAIMRARSAMWEKGGE